MPTALVVDDALLLSVLADGPPAEVRVALGQGVLFTTISWYYRLARATQDPTFNGKLSAALAALPTRRQTLVNAALDALPPYIGLLDIRRVMPVNAAPRHGQAAELPDRGGARCRGIDRRRHPCVH